MTPHWDRTTRPLAGESGCKRPTWGHLLLPQHLSPPRSRLCTQFGDEQTGDTAGDERVGDERRYYAGQALTGPSTESATGLPVPNGAWPVSRA